jgi:hypothetical protein
MMAFMIIRIGVECSLRWPRDECRPWTFGKEPVDINYTRSCGRSQSAMITPILRIRFNEPRLKWLRV